MDKLALAERFEGYSKVFASESPFGVDLLAMASSLREMDTEKFASHMSPDFEADAEGSEDKEALVTMMTQPGQRATRQQQRSQGMPGGRTLSDKEIVEKIRANPQLMQSLTKSASEEQPTEEQDVEAAVTVNINDGAEGQPEASPPAAEVEAADDAENKEPEGTETEAGDQNKMKITGVWNKAASAAVLNGLVRDVTGMNKTVCCDTKQHLSKEEMPDAEKKQETPASLKPEQTPELSESLDSNMVAKSNKAPLKKEAAKKDEEEAPVPAPEEVPAAPEVEKDVEELKKKQEKKEKEEKKDEAKEKSRPVEDLPPVEATAVSTDDLGGIQFESAMPDVEVTDEEQAKLDKLFGA